MGSQAPWDSWKRGHYVCWLWFLFILIEPFLNKSSRHITILINITLLHQRQSSSWWYRHHYPKSSQGLFSDCWPSFTLIKELSFTRHPNIVPMFIVKLSTVIGFSKCESKINTKINTKLNTKSKHKKWFSSRWQTWWCPSMAAASWPQIYSPFRVA